jgi:hypothetical protein
MGIVENRNAIAHSKNTTGKIRDCPDLLRVRSRVKYYQGGVFEVYIWKAQTKIF